MKLIAAYTLLVVGGVAAPSAADVTALVTAAGGEVDEESLSALLADLDGKNLHELLAKGEEDLKACVGASAAAPSAGEAAPAAAAVVEEKPEEEEVDALAGGMDMFGGGDGGGDY